MDTVAVLIYSMVATWCTMVAGQINIGQIDRDMNDITMKCVDIHDEPIPNAIFYRNGAIVADDPCFSDNIIVSSDGSTITITVSPLCEGYFMCREDEGTVVSVPTAIYAYPIRMSERQTMDVIEGGDITLPCRVQRPYINNYTVEWTKNSESANERKATLPSGQFDLKLTNVSLTQSGTKYICEVQSSIDQPDEGADAIAGPIILNVVALHSPATIVADVEVQEVDRGYYRFTVVAGGSSPIFYTWYINGTVRDRCDDNTCTLSKDIFARASMEVKVQVANYGMGARHSANSTLIMHIVDGEPEVEVTMVASITCTTNDKYLTTGLAIGLAVVGVALLIAVITIFVCWHKNRHTNNKQENENESLEDVTRIIKQTIQQMDDCKFRNTLNKVLHVFEDHLLNKNKENFEMIVTNNGNPVEFDGNISNVQSSNARRQNDQILLDGIRRLLQDSNVCNV